MKKKRTLLLLAILAVALMASYGILRVVMTKDNTEQETLLFEAEAITRIDLTYRGETMRFQKGTDGWTCSGAENFPLNPAYLRDMENQLLHLTTSHTFSEADPGFGLEDPRCLVAAESSDGNRIDLALGEDNPTANVVYAAADGKICALDDGVSKCFCHTLEEMARKDLIPTLQAYAMTELEIQNEMGTIRILRGDDLTLADGSRADEGVLKETLQAISDIELNELVIFQPTETDMAEFGLADPRVTVTVNEGGEVLTLRSGICERNGGHYIYLEKEDCIFSAGEADGKLAELTEEDFRDRQVVDVPYEEVAEIRYAFKGQEEKTVEDADTAWEVYYILSRMRAEGYTEEAVETECEIVIRKADGSEIRIPWGVIDENFYGVKAEGDIWMRISKNEIKDIYTKLGLEE